MSNLSDSTSVAAFHLGCLHCWETQAECQANVTM